MAVEEQYGDQVRFIGIPSLAGEAEMRDFLDETGTEPLLHVPDAVGEIWDRFGISRQSSYVYINDDGTWQKSGYGSLREDVENLIAQ